MATVTLYARFAEGSVTGVDGLSYSIRHGIVNVPQSCVPALESAGFVQAPISEQAVLVPAVEEASAESDAGGTDPRLPESITPKGLIVGSEDGESLTTCRYPTGATRKIHPLESGYALAPEEVAGAQCIYLYINGATAENHTYTMPSVDDVLEAFPELLLLFQDPENDNLPGWSLHVFNMSPTVAIVLESSDDFYLDATIPANTNEAGVHTHLSFVVRLDSSDTGSGPLGSMTATLIDNGPVIADVVSGTPNEGDVVKWVSGVPTWAAP